MLHIESISNLERKGLLVIEDTKDKESIYRYSIAKPIGIKGNCHPKFECWTWDNEDKEVELNAPLLNIFTSSKEFEVVLAEYAPGPGPSDFIMKFIDENELVDFIIDYYFNPNNEKFNLWFKQTKITYDDI